MALKLRLPYVILISAGLSASVSLNAQAVKRVAHEKLLSGIAVSEMLNNSYAISNNLRRIAFRVQDGKKQIVMVDTLKSKPYDKVGNPVFSSNSQRIAYTALKDTNWLLIVDNKREVTMDSGSAIAAVLFSPDSKSYVYLVKKGAKSCVVINGVKGKYYDAIDENSITFSGDSKKVAYSASLENKHFNVIDGVVGESFQQVGFPVFSPDGQRSAYWAINDTKSYAVIDNRKSDAYGSVGSVQFSKDGQHCAYSASIADKQVVVLDDKPSDKYSLVHSLLFSPVGSRLAYGVQMDPPDQDGYPDYLVLDGKKIGPYQTVIEGGLRFSADGSSIAYAVFFNDHEFIAVDGKHGNVYDDVVQSTLVFSPNNHRVAYAAENNTKRLVNVDGKDNGQYEDVFSIAFGPDNKRLAYSVKSDSKEFVVLDGNNGKPYDSLLGGGEIIFDSPNTFHYIGVKGKSIYLVEEKVE